MNVEVTDCWISPVWGKLGCVRIVRIAKTLGWVPECDEDERLVDRVLRLGSDVPTDDWTRLTAVGGLVDRIEGWLNDNATPPDHLLSWHQGGLYLVTVRDFLTCDGRAPHRPHRRSL